MATTAAEPRASGIRIFWVVALVGLSVLLNYVDRGAIGVAAPLMKQELGLSATGFGFAVSAFFWVYAPVCLLVGWLCDRFCVYRMFAAGIALWAVATLLTGFVSGLAMLIGLRLLLGLGESIAFPGSSKIFASEVPPHHRGSANALVGVALAFGPAVGVLTGGLILEVAGWREIFWVFGVITLLWLVPWHFASAPLRSEKVTTPLVDPVPMKRLFAIPTLWLMGVAHFLSSYGFYFLLVWLPLYLTKSLGYSIAEMTLLTTLSFTSQGISALVSGRLSDMAVKLGVNEGRVRRWLMAAGQAIAGVAIAGIWFAHGTAQLGTWLVIAGIGVGLLSVNLFAVAQMFAGPRAAGGWVGIQNAFGNASGIVGPIATGVIVDQLGSYGLAFALAAGISVAGALWWWLVIPPIRTIDL
ncbi:MFS transporter [Tsuneonella mangrovi]|uniref:MFS transporter n=1 Tax=Tsuneonella mangrovi TaxID=1982042 RepID=UPI000BA286FA|nr:MFS transporter [Tsuneonella mangrovi]